MSRKTLAVLLWICLVSPVFAQDVLRKGFDNPPPGARPRVWWHWMNGNISEEGIRLDLEWMHRIGIGGVTIFEGAIDTPQVVPERLIYMTPAWQHAFRYAVETAHQLGMEVAIASSPGWSETGGPWVPPADGIKKLVWSDLRVEGGKPLHLVLPHPPTVSGRFQNQAEPPRRLADGTVVTRPEFYRDVALLAYRLPASDRTQQELAPQITASRGLVNPAALSDGDVENVAVMLEPATGQNSSWLQFDYGHPQTIQAVTLATPDGVGDIFGFDGNSEQTTVEAGDDGVHFRTVARFEPTSVVQRTLAFAAQSARYWRVRFAAADAQKPIAVRRVTELVLSSGARVLEVEKRSGYGFAPNYFSIIDPPVAPEDLVTSADVVDLTARMQPDGTLDWTPPAGRWRLLRFGSSLTGHENGPAPAEATGLEVDKLDAAAVRRYTEKYLQMYAATVGPQSMGAQGISHLLTDSIEVGAQNWTPRLLEEFRERRGYDARPWMPVVAGVVIGSPAQSDHFLWDLRRTLAELISTNHYGTIAAVLHEHHMQYYSEALEYHRPSSGDDMEMRSHADIPMGAMWTWRADSGPTPSYVADLRGAASVAHTYGQNLVGAESMTSVGPAWGWSPRTLKPIVDLEFALGVNLLQIHESSHQPVADMAPGMTLGPYGLWFNRNDTWADQAGPWVSYLARTSYLLQQGSNIADVAYFYGEEGPLTAVYGWNAQSDLPRGTNFDFVNSDVLVHRLHVEDQRIVSASGARYYLLYLGGHSQRITLPTLHALLQLVRAGAVVAGDRPTGSPSLADDPAAVQAAINALWGSPSAAPTVDRMVGHGRVLSGYNVNAALARINAPADYTFSSAGDDLMVVHRQSADADIYFINNRSTKQLNVEASFRVVGRNPELWDAASGQVHAVASRVVLGRTIVPLTLESQGSIFAVFRRSALAPLSIDSVQVPVPVAAMHEVLNRDWMVRFAPDRGAPSEVVYPRLSSWSEDARTGIRYFSGIASYQKDVTLSADDLVADRHHWLDLGEVDDLAEVLVNGQSLGVLWKAPYRVELTSALHAGSNHIEIRVTNLWINRLIGDQQSWAPRRYAFADFAPYRADAPLERSGLLGPVEWLESPSAH